MMVMSNEIKKLDQSLEVLSQNYIDTPNENNNLDNLQLNQFNDFYSDLKFLKPLTTILMNNFGTDLNDHEKLHSKIKRLESKIELFETM